MTGGHFESYQVGAYSCWEWFMASGLPHIQATSLRIAITFRTESSKPVLPVAVAPDQGPVGSSHLPSKRRIYVDY